MVSLSQRQPLSNPRSQMSDKSYSVLVMPIMFRVPAVIRVLGARWKGHDVDYDRHHPVTVTGGFMPPGQNWLKPELARMSLDFHADWVGRLPQEKSHHEGEALITCIRIGDNGTRVRVILSNDWDLVLDIPLSALGCVNKSDEQSGRMYRAGFGPVSHAREMTPLGIMAYVVRKETVKSTGVQLETVTTVFGDNHPDHDKCHWYRDGHVVCTTNEYVPTGVDDHDPRVYWVAKVGNKAISYEDAEYTNSRMACLTKSDAEYWATHEFKFE